MYSIENWMEEASEVGVLTGVKAKNLYKYSKQQKKRKKIKQQSKRMSPSGRSINLHGTSLRFFLSRQTRQNKQCPEIERITYEEII